jgi:hypothetical protein
MVKMAARKLLKFLILFDNTNLLYFPGQFLSGRVLVELEDDTPALGNVTTRDSRSQDLANHKLVHNNSQPKYSEKR